MELMNVLRSLKKHLDALELEPQPGIDAETLAQNVAATIKQRLQFQAEVTVVPTGSLPRFEMKAKRLVREG